MTKMKADFIFASAGEFLTVRIRGEIDHHTAAEIRTGMDTLLLERRPARLYLDLSCVSFMDSSGLGLIMGRYAVMKELGGELVVLDPSPETMTILSLAGMERLLRIETNGDTAVSATAASATGEAGDARTANDGAKPMVAPMAPPMVPPKVASMASPNARKASALGADGGRKSPGRPGGRTSRKDPKGTRRTSLLKKEPSA